MPLNKNNLYGLIFAGGGGTRLWPLSRDSKPKQFLKIFSNRSLLQQTFDRVSRLIPTKQIYVVTMDVYKKKTLEELPELTKDQIIVEPARKNTGPAVFLGTLVIHNQNPNAVIANIWADHKVGNVKSYLEALAIGAENAGSGEYIVTTGKSPTFPNIGYGYIKKGNLHKTHDGLNVYKVVNFEEKPDYKRAQDMLDEGNYLWNVGLYIWKAETGLRAYRKYASDIAKYEGEIEELFDQEDLDKLIKIYQSLPDIPVDKAVTEKVDNLLVVEANYDWSDVGDFNVLWEETTGKDKNGNVALTKKRGHWVGLETQGGYFVSESGQLIATYGLTNMVVVATDDVILVIPKDDSQKVKEIVNLLKGQKSKNL